MKKIVALFAVASFLFSMDVMAGEPKNKEKKKAKAKTEKAEASEEKKDCGAAKKACCSAKKAETNS
ncbi:hypothetical protein [Flavobacterium orientale]|uniref:Pentapeptide MXKDX repeat protein n=1 Tax=Flavobacterium orientale TaxID=1756020 RepID=A0A916XZZ3_9FLAO|nr:hypothetical protein [Flavobacterium orientale]GGD24274.1 hypothetical protein GCM10011343_13080 [Flavobacterium orientale]